MAPGSLARRRSTGCARRAIWRIRLVEDKAVLEFFETSGQNLLSAGKAAGVKHHIALSVVGAERLPDGGYLRAKMAQENLIQDSGISYSVVHSTQFFEFLCGIVQSGTIADTATIPISIAK